MKTQALSQAARKHSVIAKILIIAVLLLLLLWPLLMFRALVEEREQRRRETESEIMQSWGAQQTIGGPFLAVPYVSRSVDANGKRVETVEVASFLPDALRIEGTLLPEARSRGMYEVTVVFGQPQCERELSPARFLGLANQPEGCPLGPGSPFRGASRHAGPAGPHPVVVGAGQGGVSLRKRQYGNVSW